MLRRFSSLLQVSPEALSAALTTPTRQTVQTAHSHIYPLTPHPMAPNRKRISDASLARALSQPGPVTYTQVLAAIRLNGRALDPESAREVYSLIKVPDEKLAEALMDAYARAGWVKQARELLTKWESEKMRGLMVKAFVTAGDLEGASHIERQWRKAGIDVPISACIARKDFRRVDSLYEFVVSQRGTPDTFIQNQLLNACAMTGRAERALQLFAQIDHPDAVAYTAVISACGSRGEFYLDAFRLFDQMVATGGEPPRETLHALLSAAGRHGDLVRAQMVWNDMNAPGSSSDPDEATAYLMFRAVYKLQRLRRENDLKIDVPARTPVDAEHEIVNSSGDDQSKPSIFDVVETCEDGNDKALSSIKNTTVAVQPSSFIFSNEPTDVHALPDLACRFHNFCRARGWGSIRITNALLGVHTYAGPAYAEKTLALFDGLSSEERDGQTFFHVLQCIAKSPEHMRAHGDRIWDSFLRWDAQAEKELQGHDSKQSIEIPQEETEHVMHQQEDSTQESEKLSDVHESENSSAVLLTSAELEHRRSLQFRDKEKMTRGFTLMVRGWAKCGEYDKAFSALEAATQFRDPGFLPPIQFRHIWGLFTRAQALAEDGDLTVARRLVEICPVPERNDLQLVRGMLGEKHMSRSWWGWDALGVGMSKRGEMIQSFRKKSGSRGKKTGNPAKGTWSPKRESIA